MNDVEQNNERFLRLLSFYLYSADKIVKPDAFSSVKSCGVDDDTAFALILAESLGVDTEREWDFFASYFLPSIKRLDASDYENDEYYKTVTFEGESEGGASLGYLTCEPFQGFVRDDFLYFADGRVVPRIGFFKTGYRYPAAKKDGVEWMTLLPNEINSQKKYIDAASGRVLAYGLGLGYYIFRVAKKPEVESVTCVDMDGDIISLFDKNILPRFPKEVADKITVIKADAFEFAETLEDGAFDYIYADIWRDVGDGKELYLKFKQLEKRSPSSRYGYWIEDTIKYYL